MKVAIGCDHEGWYQKERIKENLIELGFDVSDVGCHSEDVKVDYNRYAEKVAEAVSANRVDRGILICGSGHGMAMVSNRYPGVRAANCTSLGSAQMSRNHTDANVLCLGSWFVPEPDAITIACYWITFTFEGGSHQARVNKIAKLETVA